MRKHPLDRQMGLAGVGGPEHRGDAGAGSPSVGERGGGRRKSHVLSGFLRRWRLSAYSAKVGTGFAIRIRARLEVFHNATLCGRGLSSGTSPGPTAPESVT